jgi:Uri superfamily endonuclease
LGPEGKSTVGLECSYLLVVHVLSPVEVGLSRRWYLEGGYYIYVGSARVSKPYSRVLRHFLKEKRRRWHVDYLTSESSVETVLGLILYGVSEDSLYRYIARVGSFEPVAPGFGTSDYPDHLTHLFRYPLNSLERLYGELGKIVARLSPQMVELVL